MGFKALVGEENPGELRKKEKKQNDLAESVAGTTCCSNHLDISSVGPRQEELMDSVFSN